LAKRGAIAPANPRKHRHDLRSPHVGRKSRARIDHGRLAIMESKGPE
jgi:hypothetical protein